MNPPTRIVLDDRHAVQSAHNYPTVLVTYSNLSRLRCHSYLPRLRIYRHSAQYGWKLDCAVFGYRIINYISIICDNHAKDSGWRKHFG